MKILVDRCMNDRRLVHRLRKMGHEAEIAPEGHDSKIIELATRKCEPIVGSSHGMRNELTGGH